MYCDERFSEAFSQDLPFLIIESKEFQDMVQLLSMHVPEIMDELRPLVMCQSCDLQLIETIRFLIACSII